MLRVEALPRTVLSAVSDIVYLHPALFGQAGLTEKPGAALGLVDPEMSV